MGAVASFCVISEMTLYCSAKELAEHPVLGSETIDHLNETLKANKLSVITS